MRGFENNAITKQDISYTQIQIIIIKKLYPASLYRHKKKKKLGNILHSKDVTYDAYMEPLCYTKLFYPSD